ncbi:MAG TPA: hypothetical protein VFY91_09765, partial [Microbacterium sp.]|nr:hypothetical protein [Microbacterium sp.]
DDVGLLLTNGNGAFLLTSAGMAVDIEAEIDLVGLDDIPFAFLDDVSIALQINTAATAVQATVGSLSLDLPAGRFIRVEVVGGIALFGQTLSGTFMFEQVTGSGADKLAGTSDDVKVLRIAATNVELFVGDDGGTAGDEGDDTGMRLSAGTALLVLTAEGFGGSISATADIRLSADIVATATVSVEISNMRRTVGGKIVPVAVDETFSVGGQSLTLSLPKGPYLKVSATGLSLLIGGQRLTADVSYEKATTSLGADGALDAAPGGDDTVSTKIRFANVGLRLGTPDRDIVIVRDGSGGFDIIAKSGSTPGGIAGRIEATVELLIPGVTFTGTLEVRINTTTLARTLDNGAVIAAGALAVAGLDITLEVAGQRLTGDFAFEKSAAGEITLALKDVKLELGDGTQPYVTVTIAEGLLLVKREGIVGAVTAGIAINPAILPDGFALDVDVIVQLNNTSTDVEHSVVIDGATIALSIPKNTVRVQVGRIGKLAEVSIAGQTLRGIALFEQRTTPTGTKIVRLAFTDVEMFLGDANGAGAGDDVGLRLTGGQGAFIVTPTGMAGEVSGAVDLVGLPFDFSAEFTLQINTLLTNGQGVVVNEVFQFAGVTVTTRVDGAAARAEVQRIAVSVPAGGGFTLALDADRNGTLQASEISGRIAVGAAASVVDAAIEGLIDADAATDRVSVVAVAGGYDVTWNANGNQPALQANVRVLSLPKGSFVRVVAADVNVVIDGVTIHVEAIAFDRAGPVGAQVTRIAFVGASVATGQDIGSDNPGLKEASGVLVVFPPNSVTNPATTPNPTRTATGGVAGLITGKVDAGSGDFTASASVGFAINTTGVAVKQTIEMGATDIVLDLTADKFLFLVQNLDFDFGGVVMIKAGQFAISGDGFSGTGLEIFIGSGGKRLADGSFDPAAVGVLIKNATVNFRRDGTGWAMRAIGTIALLGLDGLGIEGTVEFQVNTSPSTSFPLGPVGTLTSATVAPGLFSFTALNVVIRAGDVVTLGGSLRLTRNPSGVLDISLYNASALIKSGTTNIATLSGFASFTISPATGFQLGTFRVTSFALFPTGDFTPPAAASLPVIVSADLATPLRDSLVRGAAPAKLTVTFSTTDGTIDASSVTDTEAEFTITVLGSTDVWTIGAPTAVAGKANTWEYAISGPPVTGTKLFSVKFIADSVTATYTQGGPNLLARLVADEERFYVFVATAQEPVPGPVASLTVPSVSQNQLNAQGYIDVTYTSVPDGTGAAQPIIKSFIETSTVAPFRITGLIGDLALDSSGAPVIVGTPLLISGISATATSVTYRYFLKDKNPNNTLGLFTGSGNVTITMIAGTIKSGPAGAPASNGAQALTLAVTAGTVGEATEGGPISLGPLTLQGPTVGLGGFGFADGKVLVSVTVGVQRASLAFGGSPTTGAPSAAQTNSGITVDLIGLMGSFELAVDVFGLLGGNVDVRLTGKWALQVASLDAQIPNVARLQATGIKVNYDPKGAADQELVRINTATITFPSFGITGSLRPYDPTASSNITANNDVQLGSGMIPGLTVYGNGFKLGTAELAYGVAPTPGLDPANALAPTAPDRKITFGGILELDDIRVGVSGLEVRFPAAGAPSTETAGFTGLIYIASGGAKLFPGKAFGATLTDRLTADDKRADGTLDDEAFRIALTFQNGKVDAFQLTVDTLEIRLGTYVTLTARDFRLDTGATGSQEMARFGSVGAKVAVGSLVLAGEGQNFAITGDGSFKALRGFGIFLSVGSATGDSFKWPTFLPVRLDAIGIQWADVENAPEDFVLVLSASVTGIQGLSGLEISGSVQGIRIQPSLLLEGKFPIIGIDSLGVTVKGKMFGGEVSAGLVGGILKLDTNYSIIGVFDTTTPVRQRVFYLGLEGTISIAGMAGFGIRIGLSELGPLQVYLSVNVPGGILLEPVSGLTINDFAGGVEFFKTLPSIDDPMALRGSAFQLPTVLTADEWLLSLQQQVAAQAKTISANPGQSGFAAAFSAPMVITGSAKIYSIYTSQSVFNGQVIVKISTDGKILIVGTLNFAADNISISGRLYADLSKVASGTVVILFLADFPDQVRLLTVYGKLKMGFRDSSGNEVAFDVAEGLDPIATGTAPTVGLGSPTSNGGTIDVGVVNGATGSTKHIDVSYTPPAGASLDISRILGAGRVGFTLQYGTTSRTITGKPVPIVAVTTPGGMKLVELLTDAAGAYYLLDGTRVDVLKIADHKSGGDLLEAAVRITGTTRFRYDIGTENLSIGLWRLTFAAGAVKNADLTTEAGTTVGAGSAATTLSFTVVGATATVTNPTPGASVDINVINGRGWIDVTYVNPALFSIDPASILDLAAEFQLSGPGLGTIQLDGTQAPTRLDSAAGTLKFRYWLTGRFATTGTVNLTYLSGSWSYLFPLSGALAVTNQPDRPAGDTGQLLTPGVRTTIGVRFPVGGERGIPAGFAIDPESIIARLGSALSFGGTGWIIERDLAVAISETGTPGEFRVAVIVKQFGTGDVTATLASSSIAYRGPVTGGTQPADKLTIAPTTFLDVDFDAFVGTHALDIASVLDLAAEFGLSGEGIGSIVLDSARAPLQLETAPAGKIRFRFWLTGQYEAGLTVTLTRIAGSWSYLTSVDPPDTSVVFTDGSLVQTAEVAVVLPASTDAGYTIDPASVIGRLGALVMTATAAGWSVVRDTTRAIRQGSTALEFFVPVLVVRADTAVSSSPITFGPIAVGYANTAAPAADSPFTGAPRDYIDVPFVSPTGLLIDHGSLLDGGAEFTLTVTRGTETITITVGAAAIIGVVDGVVWVRYQLSAPLQAGDAVEITFAAAGAWTYTQPDGTTAYTGAPPTSGTQPSGPVAVEIPKRAITYLDVTFIPPVSIGGTTYTILPGSVDGDEFVLTGAGAGGIQFLQVVSLGGNAWRYLFEGTFGAGRVDVVFDLTKFTVSDPSRAPPAGTTLTQSFQVVGATGDVVHVVDDDPATDVNEAATNPLAGASIGRDFLNALKYLEIRFRGSLGFGIDHTTINGDEIEFRDGAGNLIALGAPVRVGATDIYRYSFTALLSAGTYTVTFLSGRFADLGGRLNSAETESLTLTSPTAALLDPTPGSVLDVKDLAGRGWVDITFGSFGGKTFDAASIVDAGAEISITVRIDGKDVALDVIGAAMRLGATSSTFRYYFSGHLAGDLQITFIDGSWLNAEGTPFSAAAHAGAATAETDLSYGKIGPRTWVGVRLTPTAGAQVDVSTLGSNDLSFSGGGTEALSYVGVQFADGIARYSYTLATALTAGAVTVTFAAGGWADTAGNLSAAGIQKFRLIAQGTSFYIELSGGVMLQAAGLISEPLMHIRGGVTLEIDTARLLFILTFSGQISVAGLGTLGATAGRFILLVGDEASNPMHPVPQFWGVASIETNFKVLEQYGLFLTGSAQLRINLTNQVKTETLTLLGVGPGGTDLTETFVLQPFSFGFQILGQVVVAPGGNELMRVQGGLYLNISADGPTPSMQLFLTGRLSFGSGSAQLVYGSVTGVLMISTVRNAATGEIPGVSGSIRVSTGAGIGLPNIGSLFSASGSVYVLFNTTLADQTFTVPNAFLPLLEPGMSPVIIIPKAPPGMDGQPDPAATGPSIYIVATIQAELVIGGVITMTGFLKIVAAVDPAGSGFLKVTGIMGTTVPLLGAMTAALNLEVYVGAQAGVVGRISLTRASNVVPGLSLNGQFLLEINTFNTVRTVETFAIEKKIVNGRTVFGGFKRNAVTNALEFENKALEVVAGFRMEMYGDLTIMNVLNVNGHVVLTISASEVSLIVNGGAMLQPFGAVVLRDSGFRINGQGLVARLDLSLGSDFGSSIDLGFSVSAVLAINTTGSTAMFGTTAVAPGFLLRLDGSINFLGFARGTGFAEIRIVASAFEMSFGVSFDLAGLKFMAVGKAGVYADGFAMSVAVSASADAFVFSLSANGTLRINTTNQVRNGIEQGFKLQLTGSVTLLKLFSFNAGFTIEVGKAKPTDAGFTSGAWYLDAYASLYFFIADLSGKIFLNSNGEFSLVLSGRMQLGGSFMGIRGDFALEVSFLSKEANGIKWYELKIAGSASVEVYFDFKIFEITLGVGLQLSVTADSRNADANGDVPLRFDLTVRFKVLGSWYSRSATFTIGTVRFPVVPYLAGNNVTHPTVATNLREWRAEDRDLWVNVGGEPQRTARGVSQGITNETVYIEQIGALSADGLATIKITAFGHTRTYEHVRRIYAYFGDGVDTIVIDPNVQIAVTVDGGSENDTILAQGSGSGSVLSGDSGNDTITVAGTGTATVNGGDGN